MKRRPEQDEYIRQYVLGTHDPAHEEQFEERLLTDEKLLEELSIVEDEVVYDYVSGALSELEREKFEARFLATAAGQQELRFFRAFKNHFDNFSPSEERRHLWKRSLPAFLGNENPWLRISVAAAIVILIVAGLFVLLLKLRNERVAVFTAALTPGQTRFVGGKEINVVEVPPGIDVVNLQLMIGEKSAQSYQASLFNDNGEVELTQEGLHAESAATGKVVTVRVPSNVLTRGDYRLRLNARTTDGNVEEVAGYSFRVTRR